MKRFPPPTLPVARPVHRLASAAGADDVPAVDELLRAMRLCHGMLGSSRIVMRRHSELMHSVSETMAATTAELAALRSEVVGLRAEVATLLLPPAAAPPAAASPAAAPPAPLQCEATVKDKKTRETRQCSKFQSAQRQTVRKGDRDVPVCASHCRPPPPLPPPAQSP